MTVELNAFERRTRELIEAYSAGHPDRAASEIAVMGVFKAMYGSSLTMSRIGVIADAMHGTEFTAIPEALAKLVKAKVLRTRRAEGRKLYEMNY